MRLQKQSEGTFLWTRLMIQDLESSSGETELSLRLDSLPRSLSQAYERVLQHICEQSNNDSLRIALVKHVLAYTAISRRFLSFEELRHLIALDNEVKQGHARQPLEFFLPKYSAERLVGICGNLITIINNQVKRVHFSLAEMISSTD